MSFYGAIAVGMGAFIGACLRWALSIYCTSTLLLFPLATLLANMSGSYLIGISLGFFSANTHLSPEWRLFLVTGLLGGLTTFSTFSLEAMELIQKGNWQWALIHSAAHLFGSVLFCFVGFYTWRAVFT